MSLDTNMALIEVNVPDIGDFKDVEVIELLVKVGEVIRVDQSLATVESDKASMEIPSTRAGIVRELKVRLGDRVSTGSLLLTVESESAVASAPATTRLPATSKTESVFAESQATAAPVPALTDQQLRAVEPPIAPIDDRATHHQSRLPYASPSVRRAARERGVALTHVNGTGPRGRITVADLNAFVKGPVPVDLKTEARKGAALPTSTAHGPLAGLLPWPQVDFSKFGPVERKDLSRIKKVSGAYLHRNWVLIPHVTNHDEADITELDTFRSRLNEENEGSGLKVTLLAFILKAAAAALRAYPEFNSSLEADTLVLKSYFHVGFAVDTPNGLVVPVIKDVDRKGILQISQELAELARKARGGTIGPADMSGGCFSVSSLGGIGARHFTPIINAPEVAIMGVGKSVIEPKWDGKSFQPRLILPLSLSWDHRVIDGVGAARFNVYFASLLADFRRIAL